MNLSKIFGLVSGLSGTSRFTNAKLIHHESVLEHLGAVTLMCYLLAKEINALAPDSIDVGDLLSKAIVHDMEEALTGDIPRVTKYSSPSTREMFREIEEWAVDHILREIKCGSADEIRRDHSQSKSGREGMIVQLADILAVVYTINSEVLERGNLAMMSRATSCREQLSHFASRRDGISIVTDIVRQAQEIVEEAERKAKVDGNISETRKVS